MSSWLGCPVGRFGSLLWFSKCRFRVHQEPAEPGGHAARGEAVLGDDGGGVPRGGPPQRVDVGEREFPAAAQQGAALQLRDDPVGLDVVPAGPAGAAQGVRGAV